MQLKLLLKDDPAFRQQLAECDGPMSLIALCVPLNFEIEMADLLRIEARTTLALCDQQLTVWYDTPYWTRVLISLGVLPEPSV
jgi:hypothetical protein